MSHARWSMRRKARSSGIALQLFLLPLEIHWTRRSPGEKIFLRGNLFFNLGPWSQTVKCSKKIPHARK
ncbi:hypothetical protein KC19_11G126000 [Ceratodon purpureus]|uniref:Secreted protein n=1 Tax=Ceratodon purpureus TaxID=3225 RepID=A0A8T0GEE5_CERPU|nr:hypothetical protein KC19_11G126000 [Ceratodon purpureus]